MAIAAHLYDANGSDRDVDIDAIAGSINKDQLLWIDASRNEGDLRSADDALGWDTLAALAEPVAQPQIIEREDLLRLRVIGVEKDTDAPKAVVLDLVVAPGVVVSIHDRPIDGLDLPTEITEGETRFGKLDAAGFVALLLDGMLNGYFRAVDGIERRIDKLDERALRGNDPKKLLDELVDLRREISTLRRALNPQREVFTALERPELALQADVGTPWPVVADRYRMAIEAVENARELLVGCFDIVMAQTGQRTNDVMRVLTVVSSVLLPSVVIAGVMGMNFKAGLFDDPGNFPLVIAVMAALAIGILAVARWRHWV